MLSPSTQLGINEVEAPRWVTLVSYSSMQHFFVYMLRCGDGSYYTGVTNDLEQRVAEHKAGLDKNAYTHQRRPIQLVFSQEFDSINEAIVWEKKLQGWSRKKKEALIEGDWERIRMLAKNKKNREKT